MKKEEKQQFRVPYAAIGAAGILHNLFKVPQEENPLRELAEAAALEVPVGIISLVPDPPLTNAKSEEALAEQAAMFGSFEFGVGSYA